MEVAGITAALTDHKTETLCGVMFHTGKLNGTDVVAAKCGVGKVNAAMCTAAMILNYAPSVVINTGVAGGIGEGVKIGNRSLRPTPCSTITTPPPSASRKAS